MKKKYQIFISSTYKDLITERQAAVEAILSARHIPAGMELFNSSDESQLEVIKRWIDSSDIYVLILGGRYGSIEVKTGKSYIELEYEYALEKKKPFFSIVIDEDALIEKISKQGNEVTEKENKNKYNDFREKVTSRMCRFYYDSKDIKIAIHETLNDFNERYKLGGWVSSRDIPDISEYVEEIENLKNQIKNLKIEKQNNLKICAKSNEDDEIEENDSELDIEERLDLLFELNNIVKIKGSLIEWYDDEADDVSETSYKIEYDNDILKAYYCYKTDEHLEFETIRFVANNEYDELKEIMDALRKLVEVLPKADVIYEIIIVVDKISRQDKDRILAYFKMLKHKIISDDTVKANFIIWDSINIREFENEYLIFN